jgi:hypothetical protein
MASLLLFDLSDGLILSSLLIAVSTGFPQGLWADKARTCSILIIMSVYLSRDPSQAPAGRLNTSQEIDP